MTESEKLTEARANADRLHVLGYAQSYHGAGYMGACEAGLADPQAFADTYAAERRSRLKQSAVAA